jgi:hypothetical protein
MSKEDEIRIRGKKGERRKNERTKQGEKRRSYKHSTDRNAWCVRWLFFVIIFVDTCLAV